MTKVGQATIALVTIPVNYHVAGGAGSNESFCNKGPDGTNICCPISVEIDNQRAIASDCWYLYPTIR